MAQQLINLGTLPNDGSGDPLRLAFDKINNNFTEIYGGDVTVVSTAGVEGSLQFNAVVTTGNTEVNVLGGSANLIFDDVTNEMKVNGSIIATGSGTLTLGSPTNKITNLYLTPAGLNLGAVNMAVVGNIVEFTAASDHTIKADITVANISSDTILSNTLFYKNTALSSVIVTTTDNTAGQVLLEISQNYFTTGTFTINTVRASTQTSQSVVLEANKKSDNLSVKHIAYSTVFNGDVLTAYDVTISFGTVKIIVNPIPDTVLTHTVSYRVTN